MRVSLTDAFIYVKQVKFQVEFPGNQIQFPGSHTPLDRIFYTYEFVGGVLEVNDNDDCGDGNDEYRQRDRTICKFRVHIVKEKAKFYHKMVNISMATAKPPVTKALINDDLEKIELLRSA